MANYTVVGGDTLGGIAKRFGIARWQDIYDHPKNDGFRALRPDPNQIGVGDVLWIPVDDEEEAEKPQAPKIRAQGDRGVYPAGDKPDPPKRQEKSPRKVDKTTILADSFWANQKTWAPARKNNTAKWFVDGETTFAAMLVDLNKAKKFIYITDWAITPLFHLKRAGGLKNADRLLDILKAAAVRGVIVRIMLWDSADKTPGGLDNLDIPAEKAFEAAHANIRVSRHSFATYWSHHQKTVVVDGTIAYVGGLDLTIGRWDSQKHPLHANTKTFKDFYNPNLGIDADDIDIKEHPRMPWHDVHMRVEGSAALDVEYNFVHRWNFQRKSGKNEAALAVSRKAPSAGPGRQSVQIIRSVGKGSAGVAKTEKSIHDAYIKSIRNAQHFIYIENQFFTSDFGTSTVSNDVANEIAKRIIKAIDKKETFRVVVVLPVHPEGDVKAWATQELMHWQYQTIVRSGGKSLIGQIRAKLGKQDVSDYIGFFNLRTWAKMPNGGHVTEQIYVHTKMMITDDRVAIIGSANINDRSLLGDRDSELSAVVIDRNTVNSQMNGTNVVVRDFSHGLRVNLWQEHLGLTGAATIKDPVVDSVYKDIWWKTAKENTRIFERVFPNIASDRFNKLPAQNKAKAFDASKVGELSGIKGTLTLYPLQWLVDEDLETSGMPDPIFVWHDNGGGGTPGQAYG